MLIAGARGSSIDPSGDQELELTTKMGIDATRKLSKSKETFSKATFSELYEKRAKEILNRARSRSID